MTSLVTSEASFVSSASPSGSLVHFWREASSPISYSWLLSVVGDVAIVGDLVIVGDLAVVGDLDCLLLLVV